MTAITSTEQACRKLAYDLNGAALNQPTHDAFSSLPMELAFAPALGFGHLLFSGGSAYFNAKDNKFDAVKTAWKGNSLPKYLKDEKSIWQSIKNRHAYRNISSFESYLPKDPAKTFSDLTTEAQKKKYYQTIKKKDCYSQVKALIKEAKDKKMTGEALKQQLEKIKKAYAEGRLKEHQLRAKGELPTRGGRVVRFLKNKSGYNYLKTKTLTAAAKSTKTGKVLRSAGKFVKGGKGNLIFAGVMALSEVGNIKEAYNIDKKTGNKQLAKSGLKIAASVGGYAAGSALAGMAMGAACGSVVPVVGTIVGAVAGAIVGALASWGAGKLWDSQNKKGSFDKSEAQIAREENAEKFYKKAKNSPEAQREMLAAIKDGITDDEGKLLVDKNGKPLADEDTLKAYEFLIAKQADYQKEQETRQKQVIEKYSSTFNVLNKLSQATEGINFIS